MQKHEEKRVDLKQFAKHRRHFPWKLLIKLLLGLGLIYFTYLFTETIVHKDKSKNIDPKSFEIEIDEN